MKLYIDKFKTKGFVDIIITANIVFILLQLSFLTFNWEKDSVSYSSATVTVARNYSAYLYVYVTDLDIYRNVSTKYVSAYTFKVWLNMEWVVFISTTGMQRHLEKREISDLHGSLCWDLYSLAAPNLHYFHAKNHIFLTDPNNTMWAFGPFEPFYRANQKTRHADMRSQNVFSRTSLNMV